MDQISPAEVIEKFAVAQSNEGALVVPAPCQSQNAGDFLDEFRHLKTLFDVCLILIHQYYV